MRDFHGIEYYLLVAQIDYNLHQIGNLRFAADQVLPFLMYGEL